VSGEGLVVVLATPIVFEVFELQIVPTSQGAYDPHTVFLVLSYAVTEQVEGFLVSFGLLLEIGNSFSEVGEGGTVDRNFHVALWTGSAIGVSGVIPRMRAFVADNDYHLTFWWLVVWAEKHLVVLTFRRHSSTLMSTS